MNSDSSRSEKVVEDYKRHKLARSALHRIHELIQGFERDRRTDARLAGFGLLLLLVIVGGIALLFFMNRATTILS